MKPIVLVVDDQQSEALLFKYKLDPLNVQIFFALSVDDMWKELDKIPPPDLLLLDLNLSHDYRREKTLELIPRIKSYNKDIVIIIISGVMTPELAEIAFTKGADEAINKLEMRRQVDLWRRMDVTFKKLPKKPAAITALLETLSSKVFSLISLLPLFH